MNIVFIDTHFPGPFGFPARALGRDQRHRVLFITTPEGAQRAAIPGVETQVFSSPPPGPDTDILVQSNRYAAAAANVLAGLGKQRFVPDLIVGRSGPGTTLHVKDVFPDTPFLGFFDWFHLPAPARGHLAAAVGPDLAHCMASRRRNLVMLSDLCACDHGICPTAWQKTRFPALFHGKLSVVHPGIDTRVFIPASSADRVPPEEPPEVPPEVPGPPVVAGLPDLGAEACLITCTGDFSEGMAAFQPFVAALPVILRYKPDAHVVVVRPSLIFDNTGSGNKDDSFGKSMIHEKTGLDPGQVHFPEKMTLDLYIKLLQASRVHVCLDPPRTASPLLLQAMSCACLVVTPDTPLARELITDGRNGILCDFSMPGHISQKILACLDYPTFMTPLKQKARQTVVEKYAAEKTVSTCLSIIRQLVRKPGATQFG